VSFPLENIGNYVEKVATWNPKQSISEDSFLYIDLSSVDKDAKTIPIEEVQEVLSSDAPSRARQLVEGSDILVSTVRPNLNGVAIIPKQLSGATASTGYCVLRAKAQSLDSKYLFYWVQSHLFVNDMVRKASGANYPAVSDKIIKQSNIPLPPLEEQKKIAAILDAADALRQKDAQLIDKYNALSQSLFLDMFGDPVTNPMGWEKMQLGLICKLQGGFSFKSSDFIDDGVKLVKIANVHFQNLDWSEVDMLPNSYLDKYPDFALKTGDILMALTRPIIKSLDSVKAITVKADDLPALLNQRVARFKPNKNKINNVYLMRVIYSDYFKNKVAKYSSTSLQPNVSNKQIEATEMLVPPITLQNQFAERIQHIEAQKQQAQAALQKSDDLFNSLLQRAFKGELTA